MLPPHEQKAYELLIPHRETIKKVLNIGFVNLPDTSVRFAGSLNINPEFTHLEIFERNYENGKRQYPTHKFVNGDVRNIRNLIQDKFDLIVWWHGPEHIYENELVPTIINIESLLNDGGVVILGSPDGFQEQHNDDGNEHNDHFSGPDSEFYESLGYESHKVFVPPMSLVAYKQV
jgi:SAM-dependent methyltransferase